MVVFLRRLPSGTPVYLVSGFAQGKLRVERDPVRGPVATPDLTGLELKRAPGEPAVPAKPAAPIPVSELRARVEAANR